MTIPTQRQNFTDEYYRLIFLISGKEDLSRQLAGALAESDRDPETFFNKHSDKYFSNRGIDKPGNKEQTLCYLLDVLDENDLLAEPDWKADAEELNYVIERLSAGKITEVVSEDDEGDADGMFELIELAEDVLLEKNYYILQFPLDSDSHPIALIQADKREEADALVDLLFG